MESSYFRLNTQTSSQYRASHVPLYGSAKEAVESFYGLLMTGLLSRRVISSVVVGGQGVRRCAVSGGGRGMWEQAT